MKTKLTDLLSMIPRDQIEAVMKDGAGQIDHTFIGFIDVYEALSKIIPKNFTVIDLGCAFNPQCFYFKDHKEYVAVDVSDCKKFKSENCTIFEISIEDFIERHIHQYDLNKTFAICSYVPIYNTATVREAFNNLFIFYP